MNRSPLYLLFSLFFQALSLVPALRPAQSGESNITTTPILQAVLEEISTRQKWNLDEVRFSKLEVTKIRVGSGRRFEVRIRVEKSRFAFIFPDEVSTWTGVHRRYENLEDMVKEVNSTMALDPIVFEGPFELQVSGDDRLSLLLPKNILHTGLKRVLVSEGISVEVRKAQAVSLCRSSNRRISTNDDPSYVKERTHLWFFQESVCMPLPPIQIVGSASLVAYKTLNAESQIKTSYLSSDTIELLPEKCYRTYMYKQPLPPDLLGLKIDKLESILSSFGNRSHQIGQVGSSMRVKLKASIILRFLLEIERSIERNETLHRNKAEWRTKPTIERVRFEVSAKFEAEKLKPLMLKKVVPFIAKDTEAWSSLMSNISFTKFPSLLVPQEALTLDVKW